MKFCLCICLVVTVFFLVFVRVYFKHGLEGDMTNLKKVNKGQATVWRNTTDSSRKFTTARTSTVKYHKYEKKKKKKKATHPKKSTCQLYKEAKNVPHNLSANIWPPNPADVDVDDVTLVTQCSMERGQVFDKILERWPGPVSASVYVHGGAVPLSSELLNPFVQFPWSKNRTNVFLHAVTDKAVFYPVNYLRNVALDNVHTTLSFLVDCDFLPSLNLYQHLKSLIKQWHDKLALVIPAFEHLLKNSTAFPANKTDILAGWSTKQLKPFHELADGSSYHFSTDYPKWKTAKERYNISKWQDGYEPYVVVKTSSVPKYDERFVGRLRDKMSYLHHLHALGFDFKVDPQHFVIHLPHPKQNDFKNGNYFSCSESLYRSFQKNVDKQKT